MTDVHMERIEGKIEDVLQNEKRFFFADEGSCD